MKKLISVLLAAFLPLCLSPRAAAAEIFGAPVLLFEGEVRGGGDVTVTFSMDCGDAAGFEQQRQEVYARLLAQYGSDALVEAALEAAGQRELIYPVRLRAELETGSYTYLLGLYPVTGDTLRLSMCGDILPAMARSGEFTGAEFSYRLHFSIVVHNSVNLTPVSGETVSVWLRGPAAARFTYELAPDAQNPNPAFVLLPYGDLPLANPTRSGYTFAGWTDLATGRYVDCIPANTPFAALAAHWTPRSYAINYVLTTRPGTFVYADNSKNPRRYVCGETTALYGLNAYNGYQFMGWYTSEAFAGDPVREIGPEQRGDVILYAKWRTKAEAEAELIREKGWGDADGDGSVTAADARLALRASVELETLKKEQIRRIDFIGNGQITAATARQLLRIAVGLDSVTDVLRYYGLL